MLSVKEKIELEELELMNSKIDDETNKEIEDKYEYDNRFGATLLLISYCAIALFIVFKIAELLVKRFS
ncbi:hypothetical protein [Fusobacterium ulcerans]|uniref:hypothetical protein n=1 Tax=Fusobacterium ulcerans TaxID=861 RepID=UPI001D0AB291|nr:hypothetical protein [Fusobacterium ulcerans]MCB8564843.1 hypothetical protein [Fusobacterium ulcerans]MCB8648771.1 hypothetical protein [Fusobacterium ulcerans]